MLRLVVNMSCPSFHNHFLEAMSLVYRRNMEMEDVMAPQKKVYKDLQKKTVQWKIIFFFTWSSVAPSILHCALFDDCDYLQTGTLASLQSVST